MFTKGDLLISEPFLNDPNFSRSVILICEHNTEGSLGFVLNQTSQIVLEDLGDEFENIDVPVYIGGPVEHNTLHFIHTLGDKIENSVKINENYFWSGNFQQVIKLLKLEIIKPNQIRFFLGYSGWSKGQLAKEYEAKTWMRIENFQDDLFELEATNLWRQVLRIKGGKFKEISNYPTDPRLN
ncbi:MAG: YqgE/AlgH family protein [Cytophagales bacterium]